MAQQTAVDWLVNNIWKGEPTLHQKVLIEQAKQMEKEQIMNAYIDGELQQGFEAEAELYYNETYGKGDNL